MDFFYSIAITTNIDTSSFMKALHHLLLLLCLLGFCQKLQAANQKNTPYFGIHVVDEETGRGVPLIELRTVNDIRSVTDNAGWIAFLEPGLMEREVFFYVSGPGYEKNKDGFGYVGVRLTTKAGETTTVKIKRKNIAERVGRLTGQGIYRDSELLGLPCPVSNLSTEVMGQDSVQATPYRGKIFWLWGDTNVPQYPLGNYQTTSAFTPLTLKPEDGIKFDYLTDLQNPSHIRHMLPLKEQGAVWLFGLLTVKDAKGDETLLAHYGRHQGLASMEEHGIVRFNDASGVFEKVVSLDIKEKWRFPRGHAVKVKEEEGEFYYFAAPFFYTRVKATYEDVINPASYQSLKYSDVTLQWHWQRGLAATTQSDEMALISTGGMSPGPARYSLKDVDTGKPVKLHTASIQWNVWKNCWVLIGVQSGNKEDPSPLGEVWYAEADKLQGPWSKAVKVASHPRYSFYNTIHHGFLDSEDGKIIYFEGTYTLEFSGNPLAPARYDYNQLMYRLDLSDKRLDVLRTPKH